jgi:hypothetical protein
MANPQGRQLPHELDKARRQLKESKVVSQAITAATSKIREERHLAPNGENFTQWTHNLQEIGQTYLNAANFFERMHNNSILERISCAVLLATIHTSLVFNVQRIETCHGMLRFLREKFTTISQAAQMNIWNKFMSFRLQDHPSSAGLASKLCDLASKWKALKVNLNEDNFLAFVLQASLTPNTSLCQDFERHVELEVQNDRNNCSPGFDKMIHLLEIC